MVGKHHFIYFPCVNQNRAVYHKLFINKSKANIKVHALKMSPLNRIRWQTLRYLLSIFYEDQLKHIVCLLGRDRIGHVPRKDVISNDVLTPTSLQQFFDFLIIVISDELRKRLCLSDVANFSVNLISFKHNDRLPALGV